MKNLLLLLLLLLLCCTLCSTTAQNAMSKMTEGITAIQQTEYNNAKSIFKSGKKIARKSGQKDLKNRFKRMENLVSSYLKYQDKMEDAQKSIQSGKYLGALNNYADAKQSLNSISAFKVTELEAYNEKLQNDLKNSITATEANRIERFEIDLAEADKFFEAEDYSEADKMYVKVKKNLRKSENLKYGISAKANQAKAWSKLQSGDRLFARKLYRKALTSYKKSKKAYALPDIDYKLAETTDAICSEIPMDIIGIIDLGRKEVNKLDGERMLFTYSCNPDRSKMIKNASKYFKIVRSAEKLEKTNKIAALEKYRNAQKLAATDFIKRKINRLSPKAIVAPVAVNTVTTPIKVAPATEIFYLNKILRNYCPNSRDHEASGNNDFGSGPFADCKMTFTHDERRVYVNIELTLRESKGESRIYARWDKVLLHTFRKKINGFEVYDSDKTKKKLIHKLVTNSTYMNTRKGRNRIAMPTAGAEFMKCNDGTAYALTQLSDYNMAAFDLDIRVIGDTGAGDISSDRNCDCDSKIDYINISNLQVQLKK